MKSLKLWSLAIIAILFSLVNLPAQVNTKSGDDKQSTEVKKRERADRFEKRVEKMAEKLNLTEEQKTEIVKIHAATAAEMKSLKEEMKSKRQQLSEENDAKMKSILTTEQYAELQKMKDKKDKHHRKGHNRENKRTPKE